MMENEAVEVASKLLDYVNTMSHEPFAFYEALTKGHRTLQQSVSRLFFNWFIYLSQLDENRFSDMRNEASLQNAKRLAKMHKEEPFYFPFI